MLRSMTVRVLLVCGEQDQWSTPAQHRDMAALLPASSLTVVPRCGHMSSMEQPQAVNAALLAWLDEIALERARVSS